MNDDLFSASSFKEKMNRLTQVSNDLNLIVDSAAGIVRKFETIFSDCHLGVDAQIECSTAGDRPSLAYTRVRGRYRIAVVRMFVGPDGEDSEAVAWLEASRELRLATFPMLPQLIRNIALSVEEQERNLPKVKSVIARVEKWMSDR